MYSIKEKNSRSIFLIQKSLKILLAVILTSLICNFIFYLISFITGMNNDRLQAVGYIFSLLITISFLAFTEKLSLKQVLGNVRLPGLAYAANVLYIIAFVAFSIVVLEPLSMLLPDYVTDTNNNALLFSFLTGCVVMPCLEEIIFRGIAIRIFSRQVSATTTILITALLFGLAHLNPVQMVNGFFLGLFFGLLYYKTHNLILCIAAHIINNVLIFILSVMPDLKKCDHFYKCFPSIFAYLIFYLSCLLVISILWYTYDRSYLSLSNKFQQRQQ